MLFGAFSGFARPQTAIAQAPNTTLNFQARILNLNGSLVPDGDYHIEFKIYDTVSSGGTAQGACSGNCLWMETRTGGDVIRVVNGYVSANLGSVTSFPSNMPWGNNLYVTMRVGGAGGSPSWDAQEMTNSGNRMKMSVAPVAFVANNVASGSTNSASTNSSTISIQSGNALGTTSNSGNITIDSGTATGTTGTITLGATNASALTLGRSGLTTTNTGALTVTQALTASSTLTLTTLGTTDNSTFICRNTSNILAGCNYTPLTNSLTDNITDAFDLQEGTNNYININTTNGSENISFGDGITINQSYNFLGSGTLTVAGNTQLNGNLTVAAGKYIALTGGNTASRPGSPTEGMVYFDSTTDSLLAYANGKWQSDRGEFVVVAANDSSQAEKDSADYVADGTADQTEINSALTEATGGKVILLAGTYVANATILVPNNTTLAGAGTGTIIQLDVGAGTDNLIEATGASRTGQIIRDLALDGSLGTGGSQVGIYFDSVGAGTGGSARQGGRIENVTATDFVGNSISLNASLNNTITGNTATNNTGAAIYLSASSNNNTITNNKIQGGTSKGIEIVDTSYNIITGNTIEGMSQTGILVYNSYNTVVSGNVISANDDHGINVTYGSNNTVTGNTLADNLGVAILVNGSSVTVSGNNISNPGQYGVQIFSSGSSSTINGNIIENSGGASDNNAIATDAADFVSITNNTITDSSCNTTCYAINISNSTSDKNYLEGNRYSDTDADSGDDATINDAGTGTIYAGQQTNTVTSNSVSDFRFRGSDNSTTAFAIQNAAGTSVFNVNTSTAGATVTGTLGVTGNTTLTGDLAVNGNDITTGAGDLTITPAGGDTIVTGTLAVTTLGSADTSTFVCRNTSNQLATCSSSPLTNCACGIS